MNLLAECKIIFEDNNEHLFEMPTDKDLYYLEFTKKVIFIDLQTKKQYVYELKDISTIDVEYAE